MYNLRKRSRMEKSGEALEGSQEKEDRHDAAPPKVVVQKPSKRRPKAKMDSLEAKIDPRKARGFSSLPRHLQELVLLKTSTETRMKLFQVNERLREWVFVEGLFPREVQRIETAYRALRRREKVVTSDTLRIFKILPRSGRAKMMEIDWADAKESMAFKNILSCRDLMVTGLQKNLRVADFLPNLRFLGTFEIDGYDENCFEIFFEGTSLEVTSAFNVPNGFLRHYQQGKLEKLFECIDKYASRCPSINFADNSLEGTVEFLKTRKFRFIEYSRYSVRDDREIVDMFLKNGIPGKHPDPCIKIGVGPGLVIHMMSSITKNNTLVFGDLEHIMKSFEEHSTEVGWHFAESVFGSNAVGFTSRFDESKNLIFLMFEKDDDEADLLIKYESIEKRI